MTPKSPPDAPGSFGTTGFAQRSDGSALYAAGFTGSAVFQYDVEAGGLLAPMDPSSVSAGQSPHGLALSPDDRNLYVANRDSDPPTLSQYEIGSGGLLAPIVPAEVPTAPFPQAVTTARDGGSVYVGIARDGLVAQYDRAPGGALTPKSPLLVGPPGQANGVALSPDGGSLYATNQVDNNVVQFTVGAGGAMVAKSPASVPAGSSPFSIAVAPRKSAPPQPRSIRDCLHGGWRRFGFPSQSKCLTFVVRRAVCELLAKLGHHPRSCPPRFP